MGKRSDFERLPRDTYMTPSAAVVPLVPFLPPKFTFAEPCAGDGRLVRHIEALRPGAHCVMKSDIWPLADGIETKDALELTAADIHGADLIITNPPWSRDNKSGNILHRLIETFSDIAPTWLLFDADWMHTVQARPYIADRLVSTVSIGRVKWIEGSTMTGKDNCCWYSFWKDARSLTRTPVFYGRGIDPMKNALALAA